MRFLLLAVGCLVMSNLAIAATEVELVDCRFTLEVQKELKLTAAQQPKAAKVIADLDPLRLQIAASRKKRDDLRKAGAEAAKLDPAQKELVALEDKCRAQTHQLFKPILTDAQFQVLVEMEEMHHKNMQHQPPAAGQPAGH